LLNSDIGDWTITFADTGLNSNIGQRLKAVEKYLQGEETFLANYSDGLTDLPLDMYLDFFNQHKKVASFLSVKLSQSFHVVSIGEENLVTGIQPVSQSGLWANGGFFIFKNKIFDYIGEGEELVYEPFCRLMEQNQLITYPYQGFWACMDTFKEKQLFDDLYRSSRMPWAVWEKRAKFS
jgi:glucose-1-phosphate cytidylyltransferase